MNCPIVLLEPRSFAATAVKEAALSHDVLCAKVTTLEAGESETAEKHEPRPAIMAAKALTEQSEEDE